MRSLLEVAGFFLERARFGCLVGCTLSLPPCCFRRGSGLRLLNIRPLRKRATSLLGNQERVSFKRLPKRGPGARRSDVYRHAPGSRLSTLQPPPKCQPTEEAAQQ